MSLLIEKKFSTLSLAGSGFSSDTQQIVENDCFHSYISDVLPQPSLVNLDKAVTHEDLQELIEFSVSEKGNYEMFSTSEKAGYLKNIEENSLTISSNYLHNIRQNIFLSMTGYGIDALTDGAKLAYQEGDVNLFSLTCGDSYIKSYSGGATLMMSLYLEFDDVYTRETFIKKTETFTDIVSAINVIESVVKFNLMSGKVSIKAYQEGGDPSKLLEILEKDVYGYTLSCDLNSLTTCKDAANSILNYAEQDFPSQISFVTGTGLITFQDSFFKYNSIEYIGLSQPISYVGGEELLNRLKFANEFIKYCSYDNQLNHMQSKYYNIMDSDPILKDNFLQAETLVKDNLIKITDPLNGGLICYNDPRKCKDVESIISKIDDNELKLIDKTLENYYYSQGFQKLWSTPIQFDYNSNLVASIVELNRTNYENGLKLQAIEWDPAKYDQAMLVNITSLQYEVMFNMKYKAQLFDSHTIPGIYYAYRTSDNDNTGWRTNDPNVKNLNISLIPGSIYNEYQLYYPDFHGNRVISSFTTYYADNGEKYFGRCDLNWGGGQTHYDVYLKAPISEYYTPYYDPFTVHKNDVIAVEFNHEVHCKDGAACSSVIPFDKMTWNADNIRIISLPECGQLLHNGTFVELNRDYPLNDEIVYQAPLDNANCEVRYIALTSEGEFSEDTYVNIKTAYNVEDKHPDSKINNEIMIYGAIGAIFGAIFSGTAFYVHKKYAIALTKNTEMSTFKNEGGELHDNSAIITGNNNFD